MEVDGYPVETKNNMFFWDNPRLLHAESDLENFGQCVGDKLRPNILGADDLVTVYVPLRITGDTIVHALRELRFEFTDNGEFIDYRNIGHWHHGYWQTVRQLQVYDTVWLEKEISAGEIKEAAKHSNHGIELARKMVEELFLLSNRSLLWGAGKML